MTQAVWIGFCCRQSVKVAAWLLAVSGITASGIGRASSPADPEVVWQVPAEGRGVAAVHGSTVYFLTTHHELVAVETSTGRTRWRRTTGPPGGTTAGSATKVTSSVVIAGDYDLVAFDHDGAPRWRFVPARGYGPGFHLGDVSEALVVAGSSSGHVYAIDPDTGAERWSTRITRDDETDDRTTVFAPIVSRDLVFAGYTSFSAPSSGGVVACDLITGRERWRQPLPPPGGLAFGAGFAGGPLEAGDVVLVANRDGVVHALDRFSGERRWSLPPVGDNGHGARAPAVQDFRALARSGHTIVAGSLTGTVVAYDVESGREQWRRTPIDASVAFGIASDRHAVYVPYLTGHLVALDAGSGEERWRTTNPARGFEWMPLPVGDRLYAVGSRAGLFAFHQ